MNRFTEPGAERAGGTPALPAPMDSESETAPVHDGERIAMKDRSWGNIPVMTTAEAAKIEMLLESLRRAGPICVYLFGSWARGEQDEASDLDVVVIMRTDLPFLERALPLCRDFPLELGAVDLLVYTPEEWQEMQRDGNVFVENVLEEGLLIHAQT